MTAPPITFSEGPVTGISAQAEQVLRSLPRWFGIEESLQEYVRDTERLPTLVVRRADEVIGFITLREHFPLAWEVHCLAVHAAARRQGIGGQLHRHAEQWLQQRGVRFLQVKTLAATVDSPEYAQSRAFYDAVGYLPLEVFALLWRPEHPALQLVKAL